MVWNWISLAAVLVILTPVTVTAQENTAATQLQAPTLQLSEAEQKFDQIVRSFETQLLGAGAFSADVVSQWESSGSGRAAKGTNLYRLAVQAGGKLRIEAGSREGGEGQFICVSDGTKITRLYRPAALYSQQDAGSTLADVQHDAMTLQTLSGSGIEFLVRLQFRAELIAQIADVENLGSEKLVGKDVVHLRLKFVDQRVFDLWFTSSDQPILTQLSTTTNIRIDDQRMFRLTTTSFFDWKIGGSFPEGTFTLALPPDARRVNDLLAALQGGDIEQLLGQPAPVLELDALSGEKVNLADRRGKSVIVLIFWASWCAPSTDRMASLNEFVQLCQQKGGVVYAVNLGEEASVVRQTVEEKGYQGTVLLDPKANSLGAYRVRAIPVTILIGKDGTVQSYRSGSTDEARARIREDAAALLSGKSLVAAPSK